MKNSSLYLVLFISIFLSACGGGGSGSGSKDLDVDNDGIETIADCNDADPSINPSATDLPDEDFSDSNCDGIDGNISKGIWVSATEGNDSFTGTIDAPVQTISKALSLAALLPVSDRQVYVVSGAYAEDLIVENDINLYGGYELLSSGTRARNLTSARASLLGVDGDKKVNLTFNGTTSPVDFTVLIQNGNSTLDGFILDSDKSGFGVILINAGGSIKNSILQEKIPLAPRDVSGLVAVIIETLATENRVVSVSKNLLTMTGNGLAGNGKDFGVVALPEDAALKNLSLNVSDNTFDSEGDGEVAIAVFGADNDDNPNDDPTTDARSEITMVVKNNFFSMTSSHSVSSGVAGGLLIDDAVVPGPNYFIESVEVTGNEFIYDGDGTGVGASIGPARGHSIIANNVLSLDTRMTGVIGMTSFMSHTDVFYNTLSVDLNGKNSYGLLFMGDDSLLNYINQTPGSVTNNIFSLKSVSFAACGLIGVLEMMKATADANVNMASPSEFKNNDIFVTGDCTTEILYSDIQTVSPPGTRLDINSINNLNNKLGFRPDDPTVFSNNISEDPLFTNTIAGDFTLTGASPALDSGLMFEAGWKDITGTLRPQGPEVDMGAYEK